jgi:4-amino-4-deoxy-L-arabinose transferase-like glycosyltransferase
MTLPKSVLSRFRLHHFLLAGILLLGLLVRTYKLGDIPSGFFADEASVGFNAYTILKNGVDEYNLRFPVFFKAFGEYKGPVQIYSTVPFIAFFGLTEFSVRLPSAIYGVLGIGAIYLITNQLCSSFRHRNSVALGAALFLAISPWHIHFSRVALEGLTAFVFFTLMGTWFFYISLHRPRWFVFSLVSFVLALYSYFPARIFIPAYTISLSFIHLRFYFSHKKLILFNAVILSVLLLPLIISYLSGIGLSRWQQVSIFSHPPQNQTIAAHILSDYTSHFSYAFLFSRGDIDMPGQFITRHSVRGIGELYWVQLPLLFLGIVYLIKHREYRGLGILLIWLILYPVGSMFTLDSSAQATRSVIGVVPFQIFSALGLFAIINYFRAPTTRIAISTFLVSVLLLFFGQFLRLYFIEYPVYSSDFWGWQFGQRQIVNYFVAHAGEYNQLYSSGEANAPEIFYKFYDPGNLCQSKCLIGDVSVDPELYLPGQRQLFSLSPAKLNASSYWNRFIIHRTIYYPDGSPAFYLGEIR